MSHKILEMYNTDLDDVDRPSTDRETLSGQGRLLAKSLVSAQYTSTGVTTDCSVGQISLVQSLT